MTCSLEEAMINKPFSEISQAKKIDKNYSNNCKKREKKILLKRAFDAQAYKLIRYKSNVKIVNIAICLWQLNFPTSKPA